MPTIFSTMTNSSCVACRAEKTPGLTIGSAVVLGLMISDLQHRGRRRFEGSLCDHHASFIPVPNIKSTSKADQCCQ